MNTNFIIEPHLAKYIYSKLWPFHMSSGPGWNAWMDLVLGRTETKVHFLENKHKDHRKEL